ncbi:MAG TPA: HEAT repeat domain-containing protein [Planctomycetota bacterium]|nr:HEAT repeat domain-containing protein [Planctomycetota bacterium]
MRVVRSLLNLACYASVAGVILHGGRTAFADTVYLKNGFKLEGKVTDDRARSGKVLVAVGDRGQMTLDQADVEKIEAGATASPNQGERVSVTMTKGAQYYGGQALEGTVAPESDDKTLVLNVPGGKVKLPRAGIEKMTKLDAVKPAPKAEAGPAAPKPRTIQTTHEILLTNGNRLQGTIVPTPETEPVKLQVGDLGVLNIRRDKIARDGIKETQGTLILPEPVEVKPAAPPETKAAPPIPPAERERIKQELRDEILRELLDHMIDQKVQSAASPLDLRSFGLADQQQLTNDQLLEIQDQVRELSRQRNQNRVRAENHLKAIGSAVLPYLQPAANHPFELTRRAVQRIVRDIGSWRGAPLAIEALADPDQFVRELAVEALTVVLPSDVRYNPTWPEKDLLVAQDLYRSLWDQMLREQAREALLQRLNQGG